MVVACALTVMATRSLGGQPPPPRPGGMRMTTVKTVDPCAIAAADQLKFLIAGGIPRFFPLVYDKNGDHLRVSNPDVRNVDCPSLRLQIRAELRYDGTRGLPHFESSSLRFASPAKTTPMRHA